jgi:hypothetical protein
MRVCEFHPSERWETATMHILLGITVGAAFVYDSSTGRVANGLTAASGDGQVPMVNWD